MLDTEIARPKTSPPTSPTRGHADRGPEQRRGQAPAQRARHRDPAHGQQFLQMELQANAEHQQDDPDLGELAGDLPVGDEARRVRPDHEARQQVADDRREPEAERHVAAGQRRGQPAGEREDQVNVHA